jgi:hypothetical protein
VVPTIERMHRNKQITDDELQAAKDFYRYFILGHRMMGLTARYGEQTGCGGTPLGQQVDAINHRGELRMTPDELRTMYDKLWADGVKALLTANHLGTDRLIAYWVQRVVCEDYSVLEHSVPTLADVGRACMGWKSPTQAQACGLSRAWRDLRHTMASVRRNNGVRHDATDQSQEYAGE